MTVWGELGLGWASVCCFGLTVASAVFPWMNAEIIVLALPAVAHSRLALIGLVVVATAGQMTGKCLVYWAGRGSSRLSSPKIVRTLDRWRERFRRSRSSPMALVLLSSAVGIPPFFVVTAMAGALKLNFPRFVLAGTIGRLVRFSALVFVPRLLINWLH